MANPSGKPRFPVIDLPAETDTPETAVRFLLAELVRLGSLPADAVDEAAHQIWARERLGTTAIGGGLAIPHAQVRAIAAPVGVIGRCAMPFEWPRALDGGAVGLVCLVLIQTGSVGHLLREMERLVRQLRGEDNV